ncbi:MAG: helix-turn-helix transcriptional regulator [Bacteroidia bacterium]|nr:helix-turn-helix transcriptional regulator [Bacteroidia bacterium]MBP6658224.1 helix-turn-helix transcriptional regulator [Bacteroidia bacterium]
MHHDHLISTIKKRRETLNINQESLAELANIGLRTLKQIESGRGNPTINTLQKLADVLGMELKLEVIKK